jgi:outer membrane protein assembly factor BamB
MDGFSALMHAVTLTRITRGRMGGVVACLSLVTATATDWPQYRGPTHNGVSAGRINKQWTGSVTNPVWLVYLTNGLTSLTVGGGRVFTQLARDLDEDGYGDKEFCVALSVTNGEPLWATEVDAQAFLYPNGGVGYTDDGPRSTPVLFNGSVYVLSSYLKLHCLNATNGAITWSTNLVEGFGGSVIPWQNAASPVIENGLVFVNANSGTASLMAFNPTNGTLVWRSQNEGMTHSTPVLATLQGMRQLIWATQSGLVSVHPQTGALLWKSAYPFTYTTSIGSSPVVHQDQVFITANYNMRAYAVQIVLSNTVQVAQPRWTNFIQQSHWSTPVAYGGHLYGNFYPDSANGQLRCIDLATGVTRWAENNFGRSSLLLVGTNLLCLTERGSLVLVAAQTNAYQELGRFLAIPDYHPDTNKCWNALAVSDGQVYVRSTAYAARFDLSVPDLILDPPQVATHREVSLVIRTGTGAPLSSNRLTNLEVRASTNAGLSPLLWPKLNTAPVLSNGVAHISFTDVSGPQRFFLTSEPVSAFSSPALRLDPPRFSTRTRVGLVIRTATGAAISSNRAALLEVRASTNAGLAPALWSPLNTGLILSNGVVRTTHVSDPVPQQFFIVSEPP